MLRFSLLEIEPLITLFHWDLPEELDRRYGGLLNRTEFPLDFERYARLCFENIGESPSVVRCFAPVPVVFVLCGLCSAMIDFNTTRAYSVISWNVGSVGEDTSVSGGVEG